MNAPRKALAAAVAIVTLPMLAACGTSFGAQTDQVYTPADGVTDRSGTVYVLNAMVLSNKPGVGRVIAGLANQSQSQSDELTGVVSASGSGGPQFTLGGPAKIGPGQLLQLANGPMVKVTGDPRTIMAGGDVNVTFNFAHANSVTLDLPILASDTTYSQVPVPGGTPSPGPTGTPSASPSPE